MDTELYLNGVEVGTALTFDLLIDRLRHIESLGNEKVTIEEIVEYIKLLIEEDDNVKFYYDEYLKIKSK